MFCIHIYSDYSDFLTICISRGGVATRLKCGVTFNNRGITTFSHNVTVKEF